MSSPFTARIVLPASCPLGTDRWEVRLLGKSLLSHVVERARQSGWVHAIEVAAVDPLDARLAQGAGFQLAPDGIAPGPRTLVLAPQPLLLPEHLAEACSAVASGRAPRAASSLKGIASGEVSLFHVGEAAGPTHPVAVPSYQAFFPAGPDDIPFLEDLLRRHGPRPVAPEPAIRMLVLDVDGVLTDAGFYYDVEGEALKKFNTRDGAGIVQALKAGVWVGLITGEATGFSTARAAKLGIKRVELGCKDKLPVLDRWRQELGVEWSEVAYMGDDLPDLPCVRAVGLGACPADAEPALLQAARFVAPNRGGRGAVRDLIRFLEATGRLGA